MIGSRHSSAFSVVSALAAALAAAAALDLSGAVAWFNSPPLSAPALKGKVVLVDIWTYSCINSLRELPYVKAWAAKYKDAGLVVIGVHTPEFSFEKDQANVKWAVGRYNVLYPVPMDNNYTIWRSLENEYWPADYFIDGKGKVVYHHFGEGDYEQSEREIQRLLKENGATNVPTGFVGATGLGIEAPPSEDVASPETYIGDRRAERRVTSVASLSLNQWGLTGDWDVSPESGTLRSAPGAITYRFHARDVHLVMSAAKPVRFRVTIDGAAPGDAHGLDTAPDGTGEIREPRLYQLIRQSGAVRDRTIRIEFLDAGATAYSFTFG
jgi:thiol-disulfide isomerase/thioredoxin